MLIATWTTAVCSAGAVVALATTRDPTLVAWWVLGSELLLVVVISYVVGLPAAAATNLAAAERARTAAEQLTREATGVRRVRSVYVPEYETCLLIFEAPTKDAVDLASRRAGLTYNVHDATHFNRPLVFGDIPRAG